MEMKADGADGANRADRAIISGAGAEPAAGPGAIATTAKDRGRRTHGQGRDRSEEDQVWTKQKYSGARG